MIVGTNPPISITCSNARFTTYTDIIVTLSQGSVEIDLTPTVVSDTELSVSLTQVQSLKLSAPSAYPLKVQANWLDNGVRYATYVTIANTYEQLYGEVIG
jgi:hypothetical protein